MFIGFPHLFLKLVYLYICFIYYIYIYTHINFYSFLLFFLRICCNPLMRRIPFIFRSETCFFIFLIWVLLLLCMFYISLAEISVTRSCCLCLSSFFSGLYFSILQILSILSFFGLHFSAKSILDMLTELLVPFLFPWILLSAQYFFPWLLSLA